MDKYPTRNFLLNIFIHNKLPIWSRMADWGTRDFRRGLGLYHLVSFRMVLIRDGVQNRTCVGSDASSRATFERG